MLTHHRGPQALCPWNKRRVEDFGTSQQNHDLTMVSPIDRGEPATANLFILLRCAAEDASFVA